MYLITSKNYSIYPSFSLITQQRRRITWSHVACTVLVSIFAQDLVRFCFRTSTLEWNTAQQLLIWINLNMLKDKVVSWVKKVTKELHFSRIEQPLIQPNWSRTGAKAISSCFGLTNYGLHLLLLWIQWTLGYGPSWSRNPMLYPIQLWRSWSKNWPNLGQKLMLKLCVPHVIRWFLVSAKLPKRKKDILNNSWMSAAWSSG